jgi:hypothetical protein
VFSVLLWGYLGWEFFDVLRAYARLHDEAPRAWTFAQVREAGERFGRVLGPNRVRILLMVAMAAGGEAAALSSKGPGLPGFAQASRTVESSIGPRLMDAATGAERLLVSVNEGALHGVLPLNAVAMAASNGGHGSSAPKSAQGSGSGRLPPNGHRAFSSFKAFKRSMGKAGEGKEWHHIVEKRNAKRFGAEAVHNTENVIALEKPVHDRVSAFYSSIQKEITGSESTFRMWLETQPYETQRQWGLRTIENISKGAWR